jgi:gliding motility-associated lipoprotein GldH
MNRKVCIYGILILLILLSGCKNNDEIINYHKFKNHTWDRFEKIRFDIPILNIDQPYDVFFFANHTKDYEFDNLEFNMIMTTPDGEERIKEYKFLLKNKTGGFTGNCNQDSCTVSISLKKGIRMEKKGMLRIEIETLVPRLKVTALLGVGIRMVPSGQ